MTSLGKSFIKWMELFSPGVLAFIGYYELLSAFRFPFYFTVDRVTNYYRFQSPLLWGLELDLFLILLLLFVLGYLDSRSNRIVYLVTASSLLFILALASIFRWAIVGYLALALGSLFAIGFYCWNNNWIKLPPGLILMTSCTTLLSLVSTTSYYLLGEWNNAMLSIVFRERLIWAPVEWLGAPLLIIFMIGCLIYHLIDRGFTRYPTSNIDSKQGDVKYVILALGVIVLFAVLPHLPTVNPEFDPVGVDAKAYIDYLRKIEDEGFERLASSNPGKPLYHFLIYSVWLATGRNTVLLMDLVHPIISMGLLSLASYYVMQRKRKTGLYAMLVPLGFALPAFLAGGFQANSLALTPALLALYIDPVDLKTSIKLFLLITLVGLTHSWTYLMYLAAIGLKYLRKRKRLVNCGFSLLASYLVVNIVDYLLDSTFSLSSVTMKPVVANLGIYVFEGWLMGIRFWGWNTLNNPLYISSALFSFNGFATAVMAAAAPLTLILPPDMIYRVILNLPIHLQSAESIDRLPYKYKNIVLVILFVRVMENLTGLTPL